MLGRENRQNNFLDSWTYERMLPKEDPLLEIKEKIDFSFIEEETKDLYSYAMGRVSFPPVVIFKMLFLQYYANLSDRGVSKAVKRDVLFRYFVGLSIEDEVPDDTTLVKFRSRLGEERFRKLFDRIVKQAQDRGLLKERIKIVDATHIAADIAIQGLVNLLRQGRKMVIRKIEKATNKRPKELEERYITKEKIYKKPTNEEIEKEINLTRKFINQIEGKYLEVEEITDLLKEVVSQKESEKLKNKDISTPLKMKKGRPRKVNTADKPSKSDPQNPSDSKHLTNQAKRNSLTKRKDQIPSFVDPDARFGHKSEKKTFCGYKAHAAMDESGIVTSVQTFGGNENESTKLKELLEEERKKAISSEAVTADGLYDPANARQAIKDKGMQAFIPSPSNERQIDEGFS
ncbi:transposase, partial [Candidatus Aerophobetes bacterium]|nr:transposase [Candidatus Aerophobetes bacterium]